MWKTSQLSVPPAASIASVVSSFWMAPLTSSIPDTASNGSVKMGFWRCVYSSQRSWSATSADRTMPGKSDVNPATAPSVPAPERNFRRSTVPVAPFHRFFDPVVMSFSLRLCLPFVSMIVPTGQVPVRPAAVLWPDPRAAESIAPDTRSKAGSVRDVPAALLRRRVADERPSADDSHSRFGPHQPAICQPILTQLYPCELRLAGICPGLGGFWSVTD